MAAGGMDLSALVKCLECPVCLEPFKEPRLLHCQHQFCQHCLESLVTDPSRQLSTPGLGGPGGGKGITCPSCRERTALQPYQLVADLPKPHLVNQMQEIISRYSGAEEDGGLFEGAMHDAVVAGVGGGGAGEQDAMAAWNGNNPAENGVVSGAPAQQCAWCEDKAAEAVAECQTCPAALCGQCEKTHAAFASFAAHTVVSLSPAAFCSQHKARLYTHHCQECNVMLCALCLSAGHDKAHLVLTITESTGKWRALLHTFTRSPKLTHTAETRLSAMDAALEDTASRFDAGGKEIEKFYKELNATLQGKCQELLVELKQREKQQLEELGNYKTNVSALVNSEEFMDQCAKQENLVDYAGYLTEKADDRELLQNARSVTESAPSVVLPPLPAVVWPSARDVEVGYPKLVAYIESLTVKYRPVTPGASPKSRTPEELSPAGERLAGGAGPAGTGNAGGTTKRRKDGKSLPTLPVSPKSAFSPSSLVFPDSSSSSAASLPPLSPYNMRLKRISTLQLNAEVYHFTFDEFVRGAAAGPPPERIYARTRSKDGSLKEYGYTGEVLGILGHGVKGLNSLGCICIDTKRSLFLVTCGKSIACLSESGHQVDEIRSPAGQQCLCGIAYCSEKDYYIVSDIMTCSILVISAPTKKVVHTIAGNGQWKFRNPSYISCAPGGATFAVCDVDNHCISIFSTSGRHVKTFGSEGDGNRELRFPSGVAVDQRGRTFVCDRGNKRVVMFWADKSGDHFRTVLPADEFGHWSPVGLAINHQSGLIAVCVSNVFSSTQEIILYGE